MSRRRVVRTLPNWISAFRLFSSLAIAVLLLLDAHGLRLLTASLFALASFSDYLDGYLARRLQVVSSLGIVIDLAADKILVATTLIVLVGLGAVPSWMAAAIVAREFVVAALRSQAEARGRPIGASPLGKWKTTVTLAALVITLLDLHHLLVMASLWAATIITILSAIDYVARNWSLLSS